MFTACLLAANSDQHKIAAVTSPYLHTLSGASPFAQFLELHTLAQDGSSTVSRFHILLVFIGLAAAPAVRFAADVDQLDAKHRGSSSHRIELSSGREQRRGLPRRGT